MRTKNHIYKSSRYAAMVNGYVVPNEAEYHKTVKEAEQVARQHAQPGDVIEIFDVTHQATIISTRIPKRQ